MRVLVCGSRTFNNKGLMDDILGQIEIGTVIHGLARGADQMGGTYAKSRNIPVLEFPALWNKYGNRAGPIRNAQMLKEGQPELVVAFRHPNSRGTQNMIDQAMKAGIETRIIECP